MNALALSRLSPSFLCLLFLATISPAASCQTSDSLAAGFRNPPKSAKPETWWHWMNGNISKQGITADLEAMKRIGIAGAQIFNVDVGFPDGKAPMMSREWSEDIQFAIKEAHRLGMDLCIHNGGGWSSSGGPWIKPEQGMQFLTWSETPFKGPGKFSGALPQPPMREGFYRDIAVYAVKRPAAEVAGSAAPVRIENIRAKAAFERGDRIDPSDAATPESALTKSADVVLVTSSLPASGELTWQAPDGDWTLIRMGYTPTGETNHPAPVTGRGLECDKLSRAALDTHWAGMMGPIVKEAGKLAGQSLNNCLIDSYEVGTQNWSPQFRQEFQKRCGYDPLKYLPVVTGRVIESTEVSERFLWDMRRTICDLFADNYYGYLAQTCHNNGLMFSTEPYGNGEFDNLQIGGVADVPMGEFWVGNGAIETTKLAASAGHIYGHPIIGAESFTADTPHARWTIDPYAMKALGDRVFTLGVNRYIFHRYAHQPWMNLRPGMTMGPWGTNLERTITWWEQGAEWMKYIARCQYLLQSGHFVADVAVFTGDDGPNDLPMLKGNLIPDGYDYDGIDRVSLQRLSVKDGWLVLPSGMRYRMLAMPESRWMTPESARKIRELVQAGAIVYGPKPSKSPSLNGYPACDTEVAEAANAVWGHTAIWSRGPIFPKGVVQWGATLRDALTTSVGIPDCQLVDGRPKSMAWIHRHADDTEIYFISNQRYQPETFTIDFRVGDKSPELFDPQTGKITPAAVWSHHGNQTRVTLSLEAAGSVFVVFRSNTHFAHVEQVTFTGGSNMPNAVPVIKILEARYEAVDGAGGADVTQKVAALVADGASSVEATNANFGDPTSLHVKRLRVVYTLDGKRLEKAVGENEELLFVGDGSDIARPDYEILQTPSGLQLREWSTGELQLNLIKGDTGPDNSSVRSDDNGLGLGEPPATRIKLSAPTTAAVSSPWIVSFPPNLGAPASTKLDKLISWPDSTDPGVKYFSGSATYDTTLEAPANLFGKDRALYLDLGVVKNFAEVWLNGASLGTLWKPPFRIDVTNRVHPGRNSFRVRVTNLWPNRIIGDEQYPPDVEWNGEVIKAWPQWLQDGKPRPASPRIAFTTWRVFSKDSPLYPGGLIGPVELVSVKCVPIK